MCPIYLVTVKCYEVRLILLSPTMYESMTMKLVGKLDLGRHKLRSLLRRYPIHVIT